MAPILPFPPTQPGVPGMQHAMRPMTGPSFQQQGLPHMNMQHGMNAQHINPQMVGMTPQMQQVSLSSLRRDTAYDVVSTPSSTGKVCTTSTSNKEG